MLRSVGDVDIQLLGIGRNGHIGFNEPDNCFAKGTHCVELTESTIEANKRFFASEDEVPRRAYSMGIRTIMTAKVLVVASGEDKAWAIRESCFGPVTPRCPVRFCSCTTTRSLSQMGQLSACAAIFSDS